MKFAIKRDTSLETAIKRRANIGWEVDYERGDARSHGFTTIDFDHVVFDSEDSARGPITLGKKLRQLEQKEEFVRLDAQIGFALYLERDHRVLETLRVQRGIREIDFLGTILLDPKGVPCVLRLRYNEGRWNYYFWDLRWSADATTLLLPESLLPALAEEVVPEGAHK